MKLVRTRVGATPPPRRHRRLARRAGAAAVLLLCLFLLTPTGCYLGRAGWEEAKILARRRPIAELVADGRIDRLTRERLALVLAARAFAEDSIGLGASIDLIASHNPLPLLAQLKQRNPDAFKIDYLLEGPEDWALRISRIAK